MPQFELKRALTILTSFITPPPPLLHPDSVPLWWRLWHGCPKIFNPLFWLLTTFRLKRSVINASHTISRLSALERETKHLPQNPFNSNVLFKAQDCAWDCWSPFIFLENVGEWQPWGAWTGCSSSCIRARGRGCSGTETDKQCVGDSAEAEVCSEDECSPGKSTCCP